jgi:hypothetical protein
MSQLKNRLQALTLLDRAFSAMTDEELATLVATLPEDHVTALDELCGAREGGFTDVEARNLAMRATAARGRMNGGLEQICTLVTDPALAKCIEALGDNSDNPSEEHCSKSLRAGRRVRPGCDTTDAGSSVAGKLLPRCSRV